MDLCASVVGMKDWVGGLVFFLIGDCCLGYVVGGECGVFWDGVCECMLFGLCNCGVAGCGGTTNCGDVC